MQISYTALSLSIPERVRFRYRLVGSDTGWQDAGTRREAFYTNLRPGSYQFRVSAANEDGVWNDAGAQVDVEIQPTFMQTRAFLVLCGLAAVAVMWGLFQLRHVQVTRAIRLQFDATLRERTRLAQELHDTLLQGFSGVTMQMHALKALLASDGAGAPAVLARAIDHADATLLQARHAVWDMRSPELDEHGLATALAVASREAVADAPIALHMHVHGDNRLLDRAVEVVCLRVCRESVMNAVKHAHARTIVVDLSYGRNAVELIIRDDGSGFALAQAEAARRQGHFGLVGMRERVANARGTIDISSAPGTGTVVTLRIPLGASV